MTRPADITLVPDDQIPEAVWSLAYGAVLEIKKDRNFSSRIIASAIMADRAGRLNVAGLTARQADCLRFIAAHQHENDGITPSFAEIADGLGLVSKSGVLRLLMALEKRGRILRPANRSRAITIIANPAN